MCGRQAQNQHWSSGWITAKSGEETAQFDEYALHVPDTVVITGTAAVICNVNVQEMSSTSFSAKSDIWRAVHGPIPK